MSKSIRRFLSFLLVLQLILPYSTFAAAVGEFTSVVGNVAQTRAKEVIRPVAKSPIQIKDLIATALTSSATTVFSDDSTIKLSENTKLEIKEFLFKEKSRRGVFSLAIGKMTADVKKYIGGDNVFEVQSPTAVVGVRGTGFEYDEAVNAQNQGVATISCTEGSLNLSALSSTGEVVSTAVLEAGHVAVIIGGVITISAIGAAAAKAATQAAEAGTAGRGGTGTGGAAVTAAGLSTGAKIGIAAGAVALVGVTAAAIGGGGGGGGSSSSSGGGSTPTPTPGNCSTAVGNWAGTSTGTLVDNFGRTFLLTGTWTMTVNTDCTGSFSNSSAGPGARQSYTLAVAVDGGRVSCANCISPNTLTGLITNNSITGTVNTGGDRSQSQESFTGSRI
jgi:hypothetical protein